MAGISYIGKFAVKTSDEKKEMRQKIVDYVKTESKKGHFPTWRDIQDKFRINILHYFTGIREIYAMSGVALANRKGLTESSYG